MTGTRASRCTRSTRLLPPRGTTTSRYSVIPASMYAHGCAIGGRHELDARLAADRAARSPSSRQAWMARLECAALRAAAQDHGIAGLQAQRARVGGHIGSALVDDADHAERHAYALRCAGHWAGPTRAMTVPTGIGQARRFHRGLARWPLRAAHPERRRSSKRRTELARRAPPACRARWHRGCSAHCARIECAAAAQRRVLLRGRRPTPGPAAAAQAARPSRVHEFIDRFPALIVRLSSSLRNDRRSIRSAGSPGRPDESSHLGRETRAVPRSRKTCVP